MKAAVLPMGYVSIYWRWSHEKKTMPFSISWGEIVFFQRTGLGWSSSSEPDAPCLSRMVQGHLVAAGYRPRPSDQLPRLTPDYRCCRRMLADRPRKWNHQHWSHQPLPLCPSCLRIQSISWMRQSISLSTTRNYSGMSITIAEVDYGLINKWHTRPVLMVPVLVPVCQHVTAEGLNFLGDIQLLLITFGQCGQRHGVQFVWSVPPDPEN